MNGYKYSTGRKANARLTAAAPDLLAACGGIWAGVTDADRETIDSAHGATDLVTVVALWNGLKRLRDAIRKAEGESN